MNSVMVNGVDCSPEVIADLRTQLASAVAERDNWIETARMHAKNEAYYRDLIVTTLTGTPAAFVSDDGSVQQDVLCAKLPELYASAVAAREEAEREGGLLREKLDQFEAYAMPNVATALDRIAAAESRAERMAKLLREAHPVVVHAANLMTGEMARDEAGRLANRIRAVLAEVGK